MFKYFSVLLVFVLFYGCGPRIIVKGERDVVNAYNIIEPGKTTEREFLRLVPEVAIYRDVVGGESVLVKRIGWELVSEYKFDTGTKRSYKVFYPVTAIENINTGAVSQTLYYVDVYNGVVESISKP